MKILFVYRGYGSGLKNAVVDNQANAIGEHPDVELYTCPIAGGGRHYLTYLLKIRKVVKTNGIDLIHAHYSLSAYVASLAFSGVPVVCSLMGSDVWDKTTTRSFIPFFLKYFWKRTIVKSVAMQEAMPGTIMIPNGVDMINFRPVDRQSAMEKTGFPDNENNLLFVAKVADMPVKNIGLAREALNILQTEFNVQAKLQVLENIDFAELPYYYNARNLLLLTSKTEGSPNVVKEALACNCPVVSTDVGDVKQLIGGIKGCHITTFDARDIAEKIKAVLTFKGKLNAREQIAYLDNNNITEQIIQLYKDVAGK